MGFSGTFVALLVSARRAAAATLFAFPDPITAGWALLLTLPALVLPLVLEPVLRRRTPLAG